MDNQIGKQAADAIEAFLKLLKVAGIIIAVLVLGLASALTWIAFH